MNADIFAAVTNIHIVNTASAISGIGLVLIDFR